MPNMEDMMMTKAIMLQLAMFCHLVFVWLAHERLVVQQKDQEYQRGGQQRHCDDLHEHRDHDERGLRDEHYRARSSEQYRVDDIEPGGILDALVKGMRPSEDLADRPGSGQRYAQGPQEARIEKADGEKCAPHSPLPWGRRGTMASAVCLASSMAMGGLW